MMRKLKEVGRFWNESAAEMEIPLNPDDIFNF